MSDINGHGQFLNDWLMAAESSKSWLEGEEFTRDELQELALTDGYRTAQAWLDMRAQAQSAMRHFVHSEYFQQLWAILRERDLTDDGNAFSPARRGVPAQLLSAIEHWHQTPKFTVAERKRQSAKIAAVSAELEILLGQLVPNRSCDDQYTRFRFSDPGQAGAVFAVFRSPAELKEKRRTSVGWDASQRLEACGITPLWAVQNIKEMAENGIAVQGVPTKVRATGALKTYFISVLNRAIGAATYGYRPKEIGINHQLLADIVGLLANTDCTSDDVRKTLAANA